VPTNLPPEYYEAERHYKEASTPQEKADTLENLISTIPKYKGTDKLRADLRKKLSKFKSQAQSAQKKTGKHETHFHIEKEGDARVVVVGCANVGKSSLVAKVTHAEPAISASPYSSWAPTPGMMIHEGVHIQLIDTPAIDREYMEPEFVDLIKNADLILLMLDLQDYPLQQVEKSIEMLESHRIFALHKKNSNDEKRIWFVPIVIAVNKDDGKNLDQEFDVLNELLREEGWVLLPVSVKTERNLDQMMNFVIKELQIIRVYSKKPHEDADRSQPFILKSGSTLNDFTLAVHKDFHEKMKSARIWGKGVRDGQPIGRDHVLCDGDVIELHM
jgi:ribosome-interacting GTPase 1